jgi:hypothetical protein
MVRRRTLHLSMIVNAAVTQSPTRRDREMLFRELLVCGGGPILVGELERLLVLRPEERSEMKGRPSNIRTRQYSSSRCIAERLTDVDVEDGDNGSTVPDLSRQISGSDSHHLWRSFCSSTRRLTESDAPRFAWILKTDLASQSVNEDST